MPDTPPEEPEALGQTARTQRGPSEHRADQTAARPLPIDPDLDPDDPAEPSRSHRPTPPFVHVHRARPSVLAAIAGGGFIGTIGRYELGVAWPTAPGAFPLATFAINTSGALLLGAVLTVLLARREVSHHVRPFIGTGLLGGWTTYSTLAVEAATLAKGGHLAVAALYLLATLSSGVVAVAVGIGAARFALERRRRNVDLAVEAP